MTYRRLLSFVLVLTLVLSLSVPAMASEVETESGATVQLTKTTGDVTVTKSSGKTVSVREGMRLYNGYNITTEAESYAWINLDSTKLIKLDASSSAEIRKNGKLLELNIKSGSAFFDVSKKLDSSENLNVRTATMAVGIRGTSGWASAQTELLSQIHLLEGNCECAVSDPETGQAKTGQLRDGETAACVVNPEGSAEDKCDIIIGNLGTSDIPGFVLLDLVENIGLCDTILEQAGIDILADLAAAAGIEGNGRSADGLSASAAVLGQAGQKLRQDEQANAARLQQIRSAEAQQVSSISRDNVWIPANAAARNGADSRRGAAEQQAAVPSATSARAAGTAPQAGVSAPTQGPAGVQASTGSQSAPSSEQEQSAAASAPAVSPSSETTEAPSQAAVSSESPAPSQAASASTEPAQSAEPSTTQTATEAPASSPSAAPSPEQSASASASASPDKTPEPSQTASPEPSRTASPEPSRTASPEPSRTVSPEPSRTASPEPSRTASPEPSRTASPEPTRTVNPVPSLTARPTDTPAPPAASQTPSASSSPLLPEVPSSSPSQVPLPVIPAPVITPSVSVSPVSSPSVSASPASRPTETATLAPAYSPDVPPRPSMGPAASPSAAVPPVVTPSPVPTVTPAQEATPSLEPTVTPTPEPTPTPTRGYKITFDANGGVADGADSADTDEDGFLAALPSATMAGDKGECTFEGWYTARTGGTKVDTNTKFNADTAVYAHWKGWSLSGTTLTIFGEGPMENYAESAVPWRGETIQKAVLEDGVTSVGTFAFNECAQLESVVIPDSVTKLENYAFCSCSSLQSVAIPANVTSIGAYAFGACSSLRSIRIPAGVGSIEECTFLRCSNLSSVELPASVRTIGRAAFTECTALESFQLPANVTSIGQDAFKGCVMPSSITIPGGVSSIEPSTFMNCDGLTNVTIAGNVTSIGFNAFAGCVDLASINIPEGVTSIGAQAFAGCSSLTNVAIPSSVRTIGASAFMNCSMSSIAIPDGVTSIESTTFAYCTPLRTITIPGSVRSIGSNAFAECPHLEVTYLGSEEDWNQIAGLSSSGLTGKTIKFETGDAGGSARLARQRAVCAVALDANGGAVETETCWPDADGKLQDLPEPVWEGHVFEGWYTALNGGELVTVDTVFDHDTTIFAHWKEDEALGSPETGAVEIEFDACGGTPGQLSRETDEAGRLANLPRTSRDGYVFEGWYTEKTGGRRIDAGAVFTEDTTLYAHWTAAEPAPSASRREQFTIKFDPCGGTVSPKSAKTDQDGKLSALPTPAWKNHTFVGWYTAETGGSRVSRSTVYARSKTLYARWKDDAQSTPAPSAEVFTIRLEAAGGTVKPASLKTDEDGRLSSLPVPEREDYTFRGWYTDPEEGTKVTTKTVFDKDTKLYARWEVLEAEPAVDEADAESSEDGVSPDEESCPSDDDPETTQDSAEQE